MEESMYQRLVAASKRLIEIDEELVSEDIMKNIDRFRELSKERANLDPQVAAFKQYQKNEEDLQGALEMTKESDPDLVEMGKEEIKRLEAEMTTSQPCLY